MTPKEKAEELVEKFRISKAITEGYGKQCALIAVDEIIKALPPSSYGLEFVAKIDFWTNVKQEIEKL
jgi:hypothetical protein